MDININYGAIPLGRKPANPANPADQPHYACVDGRVSALANDELMFFELSAERIHVMTGQVLSAMDACRPFRTLPEHVQAIQQVLPALKGQGEAVKRVLDGLVARGLLISDTDYLQRVTSHVATSAAESEFAGVFIRACDRPAQVKRLLASLLEHEQRFGARRRYVLIDDSRDAVHAREHQRLLAEFGDNAAVPTVYVGDDAWNQVAQELQQRSGRKDAVAWLLQRQPKTRTHGGGLAWNLIAALAAGRRYALLDDDFVLPLRLAPEFDARVELAAQGPMPARFYSSLDEALAAGRDCDGDLIQAHLQACGASVGKTLASHPLFRLTRTDLRGLSPSLLPHLAQANRIIATVNGHRGHSGSAGSAWLFNLDPASRASLWRDREQYLAHIDSPKLWYGPMRSRLQAQGNFTPFTIDASDLVPYTGPAGRSEDLLFAGFTRMLAPGSLTAHLPTAVGHRQEAERSRVASLKGAFTPNLNIYLADLAMSAAQELQAEGRSLRMRGFAARLRDLAGASDASVLGGLREHLAYVRSELIQQMQAKLHEAADAPLYWQADLRQLVEAHGKALVSNDVPRLADWDAGMDGPACARQFRASLDQHAQALDAWPDIWAAALDGRGRLVKGLD